MNLRPFRPGDAPAVRSIVRDVLASYGLATDGATDADLVDIGASYAGGRFLVLGHDGRILGCGGLHPSGEIRKMYFLPEARGRGWGRRLLEALIADARSLGMTSVHLETNSRLVEALALYRRFGFVERPTPGVLSCRCDLYLELAL